MALDVMAGLNQVVSRLDYSLAFVGITMLLYFYGGDLIKHIVKRIEGSKVERFVIFFILVLFGVNLLLILLTEFILSITNTPLKWIVIVGLNIWGFVKFDSEVIRK
jgi:hypothetical protein